MESIYGVGVVPLIIAVVALLKTTVPEKAHKYMGLVSWGLGVAIAFAYGIKEGWDPLQSIIVGSAVGLAASGFYSTTKNAVETKKE